MSTSNPNSGFHSYRFSTEEDNRFQARAAEPIPDFQPGNWDDRAASNGEYGLLSSPSTMPFLSAHGHHGHHHTPHFGGDTTYLDSSSGHFSTYGSTTEGTIGGQAYGGNNSTYRGGEYYHDGLNAETSSSLSQVPVGPSVVSPGGFSGDIGIHDFVYDPYSPAARCQPTAGVATTAMLASQNTPPHYLFHTTQGSDHFEPQGQSGLSYGPISHSSLQSSRSMCFRTQHRTINHRSAPYPTVYHQRNRGPTYNGNISGGVNVNNFNISSGDVLQYMKEHAATGAMHDSDERFPPPLCHPGTREAVIYRIFDWYGYQERPGKPIMWIYAPAGYGKTAVAGTISEKLEEKSTELNFNLIGATFFFWRTAQDRNSPARFIITLTYQLFVSIPELAPHIENAIKRDPMILSKALEVQLRKLIIGPFKVLGDTKHMPNRLIIIDGLDECINSDQESRVEKRYAEDQERVQIRILDLIHTLASHSFPLSFLILSRPEAWIKQHMESRKFKDLVEFVNLYEVGDNMNDVEKFVREELSRLGVDEEHLVKRLAWRARGHILYASTVIRHIDDPYCNPRNRLQSLLTDSSSSDHDLTRSTPFSSLYELYRQILQSCPEENSKTMIEVLGELLSNDVDFSPSLSLNEAVTILDGLSGRDPGSGMRALRGLGSVIHLDNARVGTRLGDILVHSSFAEFLGNPRLSLNFTVQGGKPYKRLLSGCLDCMSSITLYSKAPDEPHVRYAIAEWPWFWERWCSQIPHVIDNSCQPRAILPEWLEMCQRLLSVDLVACFVVAFTAGPQVIGKFSSLSLTIANIGNCPGYFLIEYLYLGNDTYHSEPLAQQVVLHVTTSFTAAILHRLKSAHIDGGGWSAIFAEAVDRYLYKVVDVNKEEPDDDWSHDAVVLALKALLRESPADFASLRQRVVWHTGKVYIFPRESLDRFFDWVCSDNV